ncbi:MAG: RNA methyltransferase [Bacilli bacterium]|jgi:TrmH family RNA methyltransferase|nr:RNA methyltransferase [Bacilli bacterium]HHU23786.1 RNA methyltransferase [Acholeplasmataceae bacterium]
MNQITSVNNPLIIETAKLKIKKYRDQQKTFLVEGYHLVEESFRAKLLTKVFALKSEDLDKFSCGGYLVNEAIIAKLSSTKTPQPIIGVVAMPKTESIDFKSILLLDRLQDPGNLGTIIRSSAALGMDAIIASNDTVDCYNEKVIRSTQGALFRIPILYRDLKKEIGKLKEKGFKIYGTGLAGGIVPKPVLKTERYALVLGNEAKGVSQEINEFVDQMLMIPMQNGVESLNVGVAAGILMYCLNQDQ